MATRRRRKAKSPDALRMGKLRDHYHKFRVEVPRSGSEAVSKSRPKFYNPLLDDPNHPDNIRHWTHGTIEGYFTAGCTACVACATVGREENKRRVDRRIAVREKEHEDRVAEFLTARFDGLSNEVVADGAELVVSTHGVQRRQHAVFDYRQTWIAFALEKWVNKHGLHVDSAILDDFATDLIGVLTS